MLKKSFTIVFISLIASGLLTPHSATAGGPVTSLDISPPTNVAITAGDTVTFPITYACTRAWSDATLQLFTGSGPLSPSNQVGSSVQLQNTGSSIATAQVPVTFSTPGTYVVDADVRNVLNNGNPVQNCDFQTVSNTPIEITVAAAATTTTAPTTTTTIAPTTTVKEKKVLPATGSDNSSAVIAVGVALAGAVVLISRRRLLTK